MKIPFNKAKELLKQAAGVMVDGRLTDIIVIVADETEYLSMCWVEDGEEFYIRILELFNLSVELNGAVLTIKDHFENSVQITLLNEWDAEKELTGN